MKNVLVIGSINVDKTTRVHHMPKIGETIMGKDMTYSCGGKGANQAYAAAKLGAKVTMLGLVGNDDDGKNAVANLKEVGVNVDHIASSVKPTGSAMILISDIGENIIVVMAGANLDCDTDYLTSKLDLIGSADVILLQLEIPMESVRFVLKHKAPNTMVILDPAPYNDGLLLEDLARVDILTPNEIELQYLIGMALKNQDEIKPLSLQKIVSSGLKYCILTKGGRGGNIIGKDSDIAFESIKVQSIDSTAAGDTFNGALAARMILGDDIQAATAWANYAAALSVTREGAQNSIPTKSEVEEFIETHELD